MQRFMQIAMRQKKQNFLSTTSCNDNKYSENSATKEIAMIIKNDKSITNFVSNMPISVIYNQTSIVCYS